MAQAIYNRYRPKAFAEVLGQASVPALREQSRQRKWHHSYIFYGASGSGKTTTARILSAALQCQGMNGTGEPCGKCPACTQVFNGSHWDVVEIDAARFRGIEDVQELARKAQFAPFSGQKKIYIIDEAHMLTEPAFNAMLKLLEEPPDYLVIILCTTKQNSIPTTVLSRCQNFPFKSLAPDVVRSKIQKIADAEGKKIPDESVEFILQLADGNMRAAENALEQALVVSK